jgi:hypothetical protein
MAQTGRKPLAAGHVDRLQGSEHARRRMKLLLECMLGEKTIAEACRELDICESRYHALRNAWLQEALELLEPRRTGRPGKQLSTEELVKRVAQLESENHQLHEQLHQSQVQLEVARIQAALPGPPKKTRRRPRHSPR